MSRFVFTQTTAPSTATNGPLLKVDGTTPSLKVLQYPNNLFEPLAYDKLAKNINALIMYIHVPSFSLQSGDAGDFLSDSDTAAVASKAGLDYIKEVGSLNANTITSQEDTVIRLPRKTRQLNTIIALPMPEAYASDLNAQYKDWDLWGDKKGLIGDSAALAKAGLNGERGAFMSALGSLATTLGDEASGGAIGAGQQGLMGQAQNPQTEVLFDKMPFRNFSFDYKFSPKSKDDADILKEIIKTIRSYTVPKFLPKTQGRLLITPGLFTIQFLRVIDDKGEFNPYVFRLSTCVVETVQVDFAPDGVASYHYDGSPTSIRLTLTMKEIEMMHRDRIINGY